MSSAELRLPESDGLDQSIFSSTYGQIKEKITNTSHQTLRAFNEQPLWRRLIVFVAGTILAVVGILLIIYRKAVFASIVEYSEIWRANSWTPFVLGFFIFMTAFPPLVGFSFTSTTVGIVYGLSFEGWFIIAIASVTGSVSAFLVFRYLLKERARTLVASNEKLYALSSVLNDNNSYWILALIRVCPLPYSLTNGALAGIPGITGLHFALGSIISSPKLFLYLFVGHKIKNIGETTDTLTKVVDILSILLTFIVLALTGWLLFAKTSKRLREIENERMMEGERYSNERALDDEFELDDGLSAERV